MRLGICTPRAQMQPHFVPCCRILPDIHPGVAGTSDIRQAFVLAPWKGGPVAATPPKKIAIDMRLCEPNDVWFGLRWRAIPSAESVVR